MSNPDDVWGRDDAPAPKPRLAVLPPPPTDADAPLPTAGFAMAEDRYRCSDVGNANRFVDRFGKDVRWCAAMPGDGMLTWDGTRWKPDVLKRPLALAQAVAMEIVQDAEEARARLAHLEGMAAGTVPMEGEPMTLKARIKKATAHVKAMDAWAKASEMSARLKALIEVALPEIAVRDDQFDADPFLFNCHAGTIDLRTGDIAEHNRAHLLTKIGGSSIDRHGYCPTWCDFLYTIMGGKKPDANQDAVREIIDFLQRAIGYSMTGSTREQCMFVCYGASGGNGKSTFLDVLRTVLGDYATHARAETFMRDARKSSIPNDIAALRGARLVTASEPEQGASFDESIVKEMTGDSAMTARFLNREFFTFEPTFKVWLATNHRPKVTSTSRAMWRRLRLIPFDLEIPEAEWDRNLLQKLLLERDGILQWCLRGAEDWLHGSLLPDGTRTAPGLRPPAIVIDATAAYKDDMDVLADFISERCDKGDHCSISNTELYKAFAAWQKDNGENPRSHRWFTQALHDRAFKQDPSRTNGRRWKGIELKTTPSAPVDSKRWPPPYGES